MEYKVKPGSTIYEVAVEMIALAINNQTQVVSKFADIRITATKDSNPNLVVKQYEKDYMKRYSRDKIKYEAKPGSSIHEIAVEMIALAINNQTQVVSKLSNIEIVVNPKDDSASIVKKWRMESRQHYETWKETPEGQKSSKSMKDIAENTAATLMEFANNNPGSDVADFAANAAEWIKKQSENC
ncbi:hypothetical protein KAS31_00240 [Candidatus Parcubacteria bacterium]|nr:hypothetical protein [Candidatus Parcubacteria bacterium]